MKAGLVSPVDAPLKAVRQHAEKLVTRLVLFHFFLSLVFSFYYDTWVIGLGVGSLATCAYFLAVHLRPGSFSTRCISGIVLQTFCALHIYQFHGLAEMHFFFFTSFAVMIAYADWVCMWPGALLIIAQHIVFALLHNSGYKVNFFEPDYVDAMKLFFHFGIAIFDVFICGLWAEMIKKRALADASSIENANKLAKQFSEREQFLLSLIDSTPSVVYAKDTRGRFQFVNRKFEEIFSVARENVIGRSNHELFPREIADELQRNDLTVASTKQPVFTKETAVHSDGSVRSYSSEKFPVMDDSGKVVSVCGISTDITESERANKLIEQQRAALVNSSKLASLGEMAGAIAHEINNPLMIIYAKATRLSQKAKSAEISPGYVADASQKIESTALRISKIVKSMRHLLREGKNEPVTLTSLRSVITETLDLCTERMKNHYVDLRIDQADQDLALECRPIEISQILLNLLNNAFDAVMQLPESERWIRVEALAHGQQIELTVTDSGAGIPEAIAERIMEPFFTTKEVGKGTGLGLSVSRSIAEAHGGTIVLERDSRNTRFKVTLPMKQRSAAAA